jgi:hypothetical protein
MAKKIWMIVATLIVLVGAVLLSDTGRSLLLAYNMYFNKFQSTAIVPGEDPQKAEIGPKAKILQWVPIPANTKLHYASYAEATRQQPESGVVYVESALLADTLTAEYKKQLKAAGYEIINMINHRSEQAGAKQIFFALDRTNQRSLGIVIFTQENPSRAQIGYQTVLTEPQAREGTELVVEK